MPTMTTVATGNFCWNELVTTDQNAAKEFYSKVFGWQSNDMPMGPDSTYTILLSGGNTVGSLYGMDANQRERGVPPHWNTYIEVGNVDEAAKKAESLGATIILPPFDVPNAGRMCIVKDPTDAVIQLWQGKEPMGTLVFGEPNSYCWWELNTKDPAKAKAFYTSLLGWTTGGDENYTEWKNGDQSIGGMMEIKPEWGPVPPNWLGYIMVSDCDGTAAKIKELGGSVMMGPQDIENMGRFAVAADPQRAVFAIYQPKQG